MGEGALSASSDAKLFFDNVVRSLVFLQRWFQIGNLGSPLPLIGAVGFARDHASDKFCLPNSDRWADGEDSLDLGADPALPAV